MGSPFLHKVLHLQRNHINGSETVMKDHPVSHICCWWVWGPAIGDQCTARAMQIWQHPKQCITYLVRGTNYWLYASMSNAIKVSNGSRVFHVHGSLQVSQLCSSTKNRGSAVQWTPHLVLKWKITWPGTLTLTQCASRVLRMLPCLAGHRKGASFMPASQRNWLRPGQAHAFAVSANHRRHRWAALMVKREGRVRIHICFPLYSLKGILHKNAGTMSSWFAQESKHYKWDNKKKLTFSSQAFYCFMFFGFVWTLRIWS